MRDVVMTVREVAKYLRMKPVTIYKHAQGGKLPAFKVGREWRFRADELRAWVQARSRRSDTFARRFDALWERLRQRAEAAGCGPGDIPRLIREVRLARGRARPSSRGR